MDLSQPAAVLVPGLTMPLLAALAHRGSPASAAQLHRIVGTGTQAGVRRALERLARAGVAEADTVGGRLVYWLNTDHVLYPAVRTLLSAPSELPRRLCEEIATWSVPPVTAALYGSAARRDGGPDSDIDLLVIRPDLVSDPDIEPWAEQLHVLRDRVERWTGNRLQVVDRSLGELTELVQAREAIVAEWRRDAVTIAGRDVRALLKALA